MKLATSTQTRTRLAVTIAATMSTGACLIAPSAHAAFPGKPGGIVYGVAQYDRALADRGFIRPSDLFSSSASGADSLRLTDTADVDEDSPGYSPDGSRLVYSRFVQGSPATTGLVVADADGTNPKRIVSGVDVGKAAWLPSGTEVVYSAPDGLWRVDADGSGNRRVFKNPAGTRIASPTVTPDGKTVIYSRGEIGADGQDRRSQLWKVALANGKRSLLVKGGSSGTFKFLQVPDVMPDGERLIFAAYNGKGKGELRSALYSASVSNGKSVRLIVKATDRRYFNGPSVAPDGKRLVVTQTAQSTANGASLDVVDLSTKKVRSIKVLTRGIFLYANWQTIPDAYREQ